MFREIANNVEEIKKYHPNMRYSQILGVAARRGGWQFDDIFSCPDEILLSGTQILIREEKEYVM